MQSETSKPQLLIRTRSGFYRLVDMPDSLVNHAPISVNNGYFGRTYSVTDGEIDDLFASQRSRIEQQVRNTDPAVRISEEELRDYLSHQKKIQHIAHQYVAVAGALNRLWKEISVRTTQESWRKDESTPWGSYYGAGSCRDVDKALAEDLLDGPAQFDIIQLRDQRNYRTPGETRFCPNHRVGKGCVLGDLKSPRCLDHIDGGHHEEIQERFGICLLDMRVPLLQIQGGGRNPRNGDYMLRPEVNDEFVRVTIAGIEHLTDYIKTFPILHPKEIIVE